MLLCCCQKQRTSYRAHQRMMLHLPFGSNEQSWSWGDSRSAPYMSTQKNYHIMAKSTMLYVVLAYNAILLAFVHDSVSHPVCECKETWSSPYIPSIIYNVTYNRTVCDTNIQGCPVDACDAIAFPGESNPTWCVPKNANCDHNGSTYDVWFICTPSTIAAPPLPAPPLPAPLSPSLLSPSPLPPSPLPPSPLAAPPVRPLWNVYMVLSLCLLIVVCLVMRCKLPEQLRE